MTLAEFELEFISLYDTLTSNSAPPLDEYDISLMLTYGQEEYVKQAYSFLDKSEVYRRAISNLIESDVSATPLNYPSDATNSQSRFFELKNDLMFILKEEVTLSSSSTLLKNKKTSVVPYKYDEFDYQFKNPFKKPNEELSWRLDYKKINNKRLVEILTISNSKPSEYKYKYIRYPKPIIIKTLSNSINGLTVPTDSELPSNTHRDIVKLAVNQALQITNNINNKNN